MNKKEVIHTITNEPKNVLVKAKKEIDMHKEELKKTKTAQILTKKEYQSLYNENAQLKKSSLNMKNMLNRSKFKKREMKKRKSQMKEKSLKTITKRGNK